MFYDGPLAFSSENGECEDNATCQNDRVRLTIDGSKPDVNDMVYGLGVSVYHPANQRVGGGSAYAADVAAATCAWHNAGTGLYMGTDHLTGDGCVGAPVYNYAMTSSNRFKKFASADTAAHGGSEHACARRTC